MFCFPVVMAPMQAWWPREKLDDAQAHLEWIEQFSTLKC